MTTIAVTSTHVAGDGRVQSDGQLIRDDERKIKVGKDAIYAFTGTSCLFDPVVRWLEAGADPDSTVKANDCEWQIIVVRPGSIVSYSNKCPYPQRESIPFTTGTGRDWALGALKSGKTAREAIEIAAEIDLKSGGEIQVVDIAEALGLSEQPKLQAAE